ncbi:mRNA splicing protein [Nowakowskiella sp. JEL0078]|nr:mRNA splicing protein [Nowakowskiella sp. JEL0078]
MSQAAQQQAAKLSREDFKRQKLIEEQRKAGTLPAEVDPETGRDINPHIPHYISQAPWYIDVGHPTLKHQRFENSQENGTPINDWYARGVKSITAPKKFRKGACNNCGALSHITRDCTDRPRSKGAKWTKSDMRPDEVIVDVSLTGYDAKRDRWNGYDPEEYTSILQEGELIEMERKNLREQQIKENLAATTENINEDDSSGDEKEDEDKYADAADMPGTKLDTKTRTTVRNLRIREDTAKYLLNLDVSSAYYDPKTRSMRDNPLPHKDVNELTYAGDNFVRWSGDSVKMNELQSFAWQAAERGKEVHLTANPTQVELLHKEFEKRKEKVKDVHRDSILKTYGGEEHLNPPPKELLMSQTEQYVEYSQSGRLVKGQERSKVKSKYEEDVFILNHTTVWGSFWKDGKWGYGCCQSFYKNAICVGRKSEAAGSFATEAEIEVPVKSLLGQHVSMGYVDSSMKKKRKTDRIGESIVDLDEKKLKAALKEEDRRKKAALENIEDEEGKNYKKGKYFIRREINTEITEEELEAYRLRRVDTVNDPMSKYLDDDE